MTDMIHNQHQAIINPSNGNNAPVNGMPQTTNNRQSHIQYRLCNSPETSQQKHEESASIQ